MNQHEINKGINDMKNIGLTHKEKNQILKNIMGMPVVSPYAPKPSLWNFAFNKFAYATAFLLIIAMTGGTLAYADEFSLPGDLLYPIKRHITESIRDVLTVAPAAKAEWEAEKAIRRLDEAEALAQKDKLTPEKRDRIEKDFDENVSAFHDNLKSISTSTHKEEDLNDTFDRSIKDHSDILSKISSHKNDGEQHEVDALKDTVVKASNSKATEDKASTSQKDIEKEKARIKND